VIGPRLTRRHVGALAVLALGGGVAAAQAAGGSGTASRAGRAAAPVPAPAKPAPVVPAPGPPIGSCTPRRRPAGGAPPSQALLDAFAILRRDRTAADELPAAALKALRLHGLEPVAPDAARLLRSAGDARAWVVPVPDVDRAGAQACLRRGSRKPREGLAVVVLGGAPVGGGGALRDLVRGTAQVATDPCAGPADDMLGVSGIVPDGVPAVFLTAPDGSAVRADVHDNAFAFVVAPGRRPEPRYVVWTGSDGTPHVQPVGVFAGLPRGLCKRAAGVAQVTPSGAGECGPLALIAPRRGQGKRTVYVLPRPVRPPVVVLTPTRGRRPAPTAAPAASLFPPRPCGVVGALPPLVVSPGVPPRALPAPGRPARPTPALPAPVRPAPPAPASALPAPARPAPALPAPARPAPGPAPARPPRTAAP
jgi:hypothetical protein